MINIAVCDDNIIQLKAIAMLAEQICKFDNNIAAYDNEYDLVENVGSIDIVILDIELKDFNGIDIAKQLYTINPDVLIIFISGYENYFEDVYDVEHIYFLKKPVNKEKLENALQKAYKAYLQKSNKYIYIKNKDGVIVIDVTRVICFENAARNIKVHYVNETILLHGIKLPDMLGYINEGYRKMFVQCHQSFIVNITKTTKLTRNKIFIDNYGTIPVGRKYHNNVAERLAAVVAGYL